MLKKSFHCFLSVSLFLLLIWQKGIAQDTIPVIGSENLPADSIMVAGEVLTDSISAEPDSAKTNAIDAPIFYTAKDSMIMTMDGRNIVYLFGEGSIQYTDLELKSEYIELDSDSSIVYATFGLDSIGDEFGYPIFKQGDQEYEMKKARYNFKTKKMFITDIITQQGEGYVTANTTKRMPNEDLFLLDGRYTTCDEHDHPHFYLQITKGKMKPRKNIVTGPAYLVIEDVPLPVAIPFGFFPFTSDYSSGVIMPTYGDELNRGFSLRDGGYYFAFNQYVDLALTGEIYTKGSWGLNASSKYRKRYRYTGNFEARYMVTVTGDKESKNMEGSDYQKVSDFSVRWSHSQDAKANPFHNFSANVNFSTSSYDHNDLNSLYTNQGSQNRKSSSVNYSFKHPNSPFTFTANASIDQSSKDTTLNITLPNLNISMREIYPFKRKNAVGEQKWFEKIRLNYSGVIKNSINAKEYDIMKQNIIKDWRNGMQHNLSTTASFNLLKYISVSPSINYTERWYTKKVTQGYDESLGKVAPIDTTYGFYRAYDYQGSISANTKLYGMYKPWSLFGKWTKGVQIRHVFSPSITFNGSPDFSNSGYGVYEKFNYVIDGDTTNYIYSYFNNQAFSPPSQGQTGTVSFKIDNNLEMKVPIADTDSARKISLIDNLSLGMGYNFLLDSMNWSDLSASIRLKFGKAFTLNLNGSFETYTFNEDGDRVNVPRWEVGKGIGRLKGTSTSFSYSLNNQVIKDLIKRLKGEEVSSEPDPDIDPNAPPGAEGADGDLAEKPTSLRQKKKEDGNYDDDGYSILNIPWNLSFNYSLALSTNMSRSAFNKEKREYPYQINQLLGISGSITPTKGWNFTFNTSYDFDNKKFATMNCTVARQMHCWSMSASFIPVGPYQSYSFSIAVSSTLLKDLKYTQSSSRWDSMNWGTY